MRRFLIVFSGFCFYSSLLWAPPYFAEQDYDKPSDVENSVIAGPSPETPVERVGEGMGRIASGVANAMGNNFQIPIGNTENDDIVDDDQYQDVLDDENAVIDVDAEKTFADVFLDNANETVDLAPGQKFKNVAIFDIQGVALGQRFDDIQTVFFNTKNLYTPVAKDSITYTIPKEWKYNLDYECRQQGLFVPADVSQCIKTSAIKKGILYPAEVRLERASTGEKIYIFLTSNLTDNLVYKVIYHNDVNELSGNGEVFQYQKEKKILNFWKNVLEKFGQPNSGSSEWISSDNPYDPKMSAAYGELILENQGLYYKDLEENAKNSEENFKAKDYAF